MIDILIQNTHSKFIFKNAIPGEKFIVDELLKEKFTVEDYSLQRNSVMVQRGLISPYKCFYDIKYSVIPTGLIPFVKIYFEQNHIEYELTDLRDFPLVDKEFLQQISDGSVIYGKDKFGNDKEYEPRHYQITALLKIVKNKGGIFSGTMGTGKTFLSFLINKAYPKDKILYVFNRLDLIYQTRDAFISYGEDPNNIGIINSDYEQYDKRITLLSMQSYEKAASIFPEVKIIIVDEAHQTGRTDVSERIIYSCQKASVKIGLSATPNDIENPYQQMRLYANIGPIIYEYQLKQGIDEQFLSKTEVKMVNIELEEEIPILGQWGDVYDYKAVTDSNEGEQLVSYKGKTVWKNLSFRGDEYNHYVNNDIRNNAIKQVAEQHSSVGDRVLILYNRIEHGEKLKEIIENSKLISGKDDKDIRDKAETYLKNNEGAIVISSKIWSQGKDIEEINVVIIASAGKGAIKIIQESGRGTRLSPRTEKDKAIIYDFYDNFSPIGRKQSNKRKLIYESRLELPVNIITLN